MDMTTAKPFACKSDGCGMSFTNEDHLSVHEKKHEMMLNLSLSGQKSGNIFVADQTPTPTRLIKNCEEVGLFDDLRDVNPFDETFRRAVEQQSGETPSQTHAGGSELDRNPEEDSLHTPQVYPQLDSSDVVGFRSCGLLEKQPESPGAPVTLDMPVVEGNPQGEVRKSAVSISRQSSSSSLGCSYGKFHKYRSIAEKPVATSMSGPPVVQLPASIQLIQPQVITLSFPSSSSYSVGSSMARNAHSSGGPAIPVQTVKPFIMPKLTPAPAERVVNASSPAAPTSMSAPSTPLVPGPHSTQPEPSSASLTPTSQLPIKERLKVILSNNSKSRIIELPQKTSSRRTRAVDVKSPSKCDEDFMERRRAASTRYRIKMRSIHEDLRRQNVELQTENEKLRERVTQLEKQLAAQKSHTASADNNTIVNPWTTSMPAQIQIPPSTVHLVMNIPKLIIPPSGSPIIQNPITFKVEKK